MEQRCRKLDTEKLIADFMPELLPGIVCKQTVQYFHFGIYAIIIMPENLSRL